VRERVEVTDVALRDGMQNLPRPVPTEQKLALLDQLVAAGVSYIQVTSFVHPEWVPQMADAEAVAAALSRFSGVEFSALILNFKGYERARAAGLRHLEFAMAASDTFQRRNANRGLAESLEILRQVSEAAVQDGVQLHVNFATSFHCPFQGVIPAASVVKVVSAARELGNFRIGLSDTDGMAFPAQVKQTVAAVREETGVGSNELSLHFHDTYGRGLANALAGLEEGVRSFDGAVGGLGGCPFCPGASGNLATEDLVAFLEGQGYETGIDLNKLLDAAELANRLSPQPYQAHLLRARRPAAFAAL
jgi:hydroxymethylglutaryl-CoA lyase